MPFVPPRPACAHLQHLSRHRVAAGTLADRSWQYRKCDEIRKILAEDATRDRKTGRPLVYASTDAHSLRRYSDETWSATSSAGPCAT